MGRINQTRLERSSPFTRFLLGFGGQGPQVLAADAKERAAQQKQQQAQAKAQKDIFDTATKTLKGVADQAKAIPFDQIGKFRTSIQPVLTAISENMESVRPGSSTIVAPTLSAAFATIQSPAAAGKAAGKKAKAEAGVTGVPVGGTNFKNVVSPDGTSQIVNMSDAAAVAKLPEGSRVFTAQVQPTSVAGLGVAGKKGKEKARGEIAESTGNIFEAIKVMKSLQKATGASGIRGGIAETVGGILSQIPIVGDDLGEAFTEFVAGASAQEVAEFRSNARFFTARMLSTITKEEGRFSESERAEARQALRALRPDASVSQIRTAIKTAVQIDLLNRERAKIRAGGASLSKFTQSMTEDSLTAESIKLLKFGLSPKEAVDLAIRMFSEMTDLAEQLGGNQ